MIDPFITLCWVIFFVVWIVSAFATKRTAERAWRDGWWVWTAAAALLVVVGRRGVPRGGVTLWVPTPRLRAVADAITAAGVVVALWARAVLGGNWSSIVAIKEDHELVERGPYRYMRHPIYTGVILMVAGATVALGRLIALVALGAVVLGLSLKARSEEQLLTKHFADAYPRYRARVRAALIPFVL